MNTTDPAVTVDLLTTQHLGSFLVVLALGAVIGVLAVIAVLSALGWPADYDHDYEDDDWPDDEQPTEPRTVRIPRVRPEWQQ